MDRLTKKIEIPVAKNIIKKAGLYIVPENRFDELAEVAADAFHDYPLHNWLTKGSYDPFVSKMIMKATLESMEKTALIYADSEELNGFAVWEPLGFTGSESLPFLKNGGAKLLFRQGLGIMRKLVVYENFAMELKKKYTGNVDWYLYNLTIKRSMQGKGLGKKLLLPMLKLCDDDKMYAYLETNKESNVSLYQRFGFELRETNLIPGSDVKHYSMVRDPK